MAAMHAVEIADRHHRAFAARRAHRRNDGRCAFRPSRLAAWAPAPAPRLPPPACRSLCRRSPSPRRGARRSPCTVQVVTTVSPIRTGALNIDAGGHEDRARARQLRAHHRRDEADGQHAMRDPAAEYGLAGIVLVEMHRIHVAGGFAEQLDVALGDGVVDAGRLARASGLRNKVIASPFERRAWLPWRRHAGRRTFAEMTCGIRLDLLAMHAIGDEQRLEPGRLAPLMSVTSPSPIASGFFGFRPPPSAPRHRSADGLAVIDHLAAQLLIGLAPARRRTSKAACRDAPPDRDWRRASGDSGPASAASIPA